MSSSFRRRGTPKVSAVVPSEKSDQAPSPVTALHTGTPLSSVSLVGTKPWTGGLTLTSFGLREVDSLFLGGGGQPLRTAILLEEDRWTNDLAQSLMRYWSAEAVAQGQTLLMPYSKKDPPIHSSLPRGMQLREDEKKEGHSMSASVGSSPTDLREFVKSLPRNLHLDKTRAATSKNEEAHQTMVDTRSPFDAIQEADEEDNDSDGLNGDSPKDEEGLTIAWQYRASVQQKRLGHSTKSTFSSKRSLLKTVYCHSYDLSARMVDQFPREWFSESDAGGESKITVVNGCCCSENILCSHRTCGFRLYQKWLTEIHACLEGGGAGTVVRFLVRNAPVSTASIALPLLMSQIQHHSLPVVVLVSVRSWECGPELTILRRACHLVLATESFAAVQVGTPPEFRDLAGILSILKWDCLPIGSSPADRRYGMKRDRRKLHIAMLHLPPEDYSGADGLGSVSSGVRSGAGRPTKTTEASASSSAAPPKSHGTSCSSSLLDF